MESRFAACLNGLLQQNRPAVDRLFRALAAGIPALTLILPKPANKRICLDVARKFLRNFIF
jgi:hypothetical protein